MSVMRLRSLTSLRVVVVVLLIVAAVAIVMLRARPMALSIRVHHYDRRAEGLFAFVALSNAGAAPLAVPERFECQVEMTSGFTNYIADTRYTFFLQPRQDVVLSLTNHAIQLPADTSNWTVNVRIRHPTRRERFVNTLMRCGVRNWRFLSRLSGPPRKDEEFQWQECRSRSFAVSLAPSSGDRE